MFNRLASSAPRRGALRATVALALATGAVTALGTTSANAATVTLSALSGKSGGGNTITAVHPTAAFYSGSVNVQFQVPATSTSKCTNGWQSPVAISSATAGVVDATSGTKLLSTTKLAVTIPGGVALPNGVTNLTLNFCVYNSTSAPSGTTSNLIADGKYTIAAAPTINAMNNVTPGIKPAAGPALGGNTVQVNGTGFVGSTTVPLTATLGGVALTNIKANTAGTMFTATVPSRAAANGVALTVNAIGGSVTLTGAYDFTNGLVISPTTTPTATTATDLDVQGAGFSTMNWTTYGGATPGTNKTDGTTPNSLGAHVYLVNGAYNPADSTGNKTVPDVAECLNVLVISDTELICTLNTAKAYGQNADAAVPNGTYTLTVVSNGGVDVQSGGANVDAALPFQASIITSGSTFTVAPY